MPVLFRLGAFGYAVAVLALNCAIMALTGWVVDSALGTSLMPVFVIATLLAVNRTAHESGTNVFSFGKMLPFPAVAAVLAVLLQWVFPEFATSLMLMAGADAQLNLLQLVFFAALASVLVNFAVAEFLSKFFYPRWNKLWNTQHSPTVS